MKTTSMRCMWEIHLFEWRCREARIHFNGRGTVASFVRNRTRTYTSPIIYQMAKQMLRYVYMSRKCHCSPFSLMEGLSVFRSSATKCVEKYLQWSYTSYTDLSLDLCCGSSMPNFCFELDTLAYLVWCLISQKLPSFWLIGMWFGLVNKVGLFFSANSYFL